MSVCAINKTISPNHPTFNKKIALLDVLLAIPCNKICPYGVVYTDVDLCVRLPRIMRWSIIRTFLSPTSRKIDTKNIKKKKKTKKNCYVIKITNLVVKHHMLFSIYNLFYVTLRVRVRLLRK